MIADLSGRRWTLLSTGGAQGAASFKVELRASRGCDQQPGARAKPTGLRDACAEAQPRPFDEHGDHSRVCARIRMKCPALECKYNTK